MRDESGKLVSFVPANEDYKAARETVIVDRKYRVPVDVLTMTELVHRDEESAQAVMDLYKTLAPELQEGPLDEVIDLDLLPEDPAVFPEYLDYLLKVLASIQHFDMARGVSFRVKSSRPDKVTQAMKHPLGYILKEEGAGQSGRAEVNLSLPGRFRAGEPNLPVAKFEVGKELRLRAYILFGILAGRWAAQHKGEAPHPTIVEAYGQFLKAGESADDLGELPLVLRAFLSGHTGGRIYEWAVRFALPTLRPLGWARLLQFFKNEERILLQAA